MNRLTFINKKTMRAARFLAFVAVFALFSSVSFAQTQTSGGTQITNQASASYSDGNGNTYQTVSNTVTVTVANVSGLAITPDAGSRASIVPGQQGVVYPFTVTNLGNFSDQVRFLANGQSIQMTGSATLSRAVIDVNGNGSIDAGDTNILSNAADVLSVALAQNGSLTVLVEVNVNANAAPGSVVNVQLGDTLTNSPTFDNQPANISAHEVRSVSTASVNGLREARGDVSATVDTDAQLVIRLTAPAGPVTLGSTIQYTWDLCNTGLRPANAFTLANAPAGSNTGVFIFAPVPVGTTIGSQTFPAGTLYTTSPLSVSPQTAVWQVWTGNGPANLSGVRRVAFNNGTSLAAGACISPINMQVTITTSDATLDIYQIGDVYATNTVGATITDQSGDNVPNAGDGNANYNEANQPGNVDGNGIQQVTILSRIGSTLIGPSGFPTAIGPNSNNDDYTNRSSSVPGIPAGGVTTSALSLTYTNTLQNTGNANDVYTLSLQSAPAGFTVEISLDGGANYTTVTTNTLSLPINFGQQANIMVRVTAPVGTNVLQENGFPVVIRSTSTVTPTAYNETIDRFYTGFLRMDKTSQIFNNTGVGGANDPVPGAEIEYTITYRNLATSGGTNNSTLSVSNLVITENGSVAPNNWAASTTQVVGSGVDSTGGAITGDSTGSTLLTDTVTTVAPGSTGTFKFRRRIN